MKNVIVTGANGFIGSSLIRKLIEHEVNVIAIDISFANSRLPESGHITKIETDIDSAESLLSAVPRKEYDAFYHFAWRGVNGPDKASPEVQLANMQLAVTCVQVAKALDCRKLLVAGTIAEESVQSLPHLTKTSGGMMYGTAKHCTHLMLETYCKNIGQQLVWMQFSNIYGIGNKTGNLVSYTLGEILNDREATFGPALQPYDFIYVDDLIEAVFRLGIKEESKGAYFIGSGESRVLRDYLKEIGTIAGKPSLIKIGVRPDDGIKYEPTMFDTTALRHVIGDFVSTTFQDGIRKTIEWYKTTL